MRAESRLVILVVKSTEDMVVFVMVLRLRRSGWVKGTDGTAGVV